MKAKRFLSLMLSLTLAVSLTAPALAMEAPAETSERLTFYAFKVQYLADHPELRDDFDADAWFATCYSWWSKDEYMNSFGYDEEAFRDAMWEDYAWSDSGLSPIISDAYNAYEVDYYDATHPGELDKLDTQTLLEMAGYHDLTAEEWYMEDHYLSSVEEVRPSLLSNYITYRLMAEDNHGYFLIYQEQYPDQAAAFDPNAYFAEQYGGFMTKEEYMNSYFLLSEEEFFEDMFLEYAADNSLAWSLNFKWPQDPIDLTLVVNGQTNYDAVVTEENWVTYTDGATLNAILGTDYPAGERVSIREAATAAGWDVVWNATGNEVVLLDRERLRAGNIYPQDLDIPTPDFTAFDGLMSRLLADSAYDADKAYRVDQTQKLTFTALNSLDGDKTVTATLKGQITMSGTALEAEYTLSCAQLLELLSPQVQAQLEGILPKFKREDVKSLLTAGKLTIRADLETGDTYIHAPILALFDDSFAGDTWLHGQADFSETLALLDMARAGSWDTKAFLYDYLLTSSADSWSAQSAYSAFQQSYGMLSALAGPHFLTEKNGVYTWTMNGDALALLGSAVMGYTGQEDQDFGKFFKEFNVTLRVDKSAQMTMDTTIRPDMDALGAFIATEDGYGEADPAETALITWVMNLLDFRATAHAAGDADDLTEESSFHWKNQFKATVDSKTTRRTTNTAPNALPPKGANIVEF